MTSDLVQFGLVLLGMLFLAGLLLWAFVGRGRDDSARCKELMEANAELQYASLHDPLTGLANRILLDERLSQAVRAAEREGESFALMMLDLDRFKQVNDTLGHDVGDKLLHEIGVRLTQLLRDTDTIARIGGDEFGVLAKISARDQVALLAAKLLDEFDRPFVVGGSELEIKASIGVAVFPHHAHDVETLYRNADAAMYQAKRVGSRFAVYDTEFDPSVLDRLALIGRLRDAITNRELVLFYQPKIDLRSGKPCGLEALVRWQHPNFGLLNPETFMPLAEQSGVIRSLTLLVLEQALDFLVSLGESGVQIAVNISARVFEEQDWPEEVSRLLQQRNLNADMLKFEITESVVIDSVVDPVPMLHRLRTMGVGLSVDDFGVGYSSLSYLKELPVQELKIDRSFVSGMEEDQRNQAIVDSVVKLAHSLGLMVVAEGVEQKTTLNMLRKCDCDIAQGSLIGAPMPAGACSDWLRKN